MDRPTCPTVQPDHTTELLSLIGHRPLEELLIYLITTALEAHHAGTLSEYRCKRTQLLIERTLPKV